MTLTTTPTPSPVKTSLPCLRVFSPGFHSLSPPPHPHNKCILSCIPLVIALTKLPFLLNFCSFSSHQLFVSGDFLLHSLLGMYVMVAGQLRLIGSPDEVQYPSIQVLKIADLSNNPHSEALWMMEVIDAQSRIKHMKRC